MDRETHYEASEARYAALGALPRDKRALFVSQAAAATRLTIHQFDGGRDAKYLFISPTASQPAAGITRKGHSWPVRETIGYRPEVAGTDIIYDVTLERMQGKARPFAVEFRDASPQVFALLPVQIEAIQARVVPKASGSILEVEFHDATGDRLQAVLPFYLEIRTRGGKPTTSAYFATGRDGRYHSGPELLDGASAGDQIVVRSQLTGQEDVLPAART